MNLETFSSLLVEHKKLIKLEVKLNKAIESFSFSENPLTFNRYHSLFMKTFKLAMKDNNSWIEYFLYDMNATFTKDKVGKDKNGKTIYIRCYRDLYELIINNK